jgi:hypothetical protein
MAKRATKKVLSKSRAVSPKSVRNTKGTSMRAKSVARSTAKRPSKSIGAIIRSDTGESIRVTGGPKLQEFAVRWSYLIRNRTPRSAAAASEMTSKLRSDIQNLGLDSVKLGKLAQAEWIEVEIPFRSEHENWESRILPWEFLLTRAIPLPEQKLPPIVTRFLNCSETAPSKPIDWKRPLVYVESAPGKLERFYSFHRERQMIPKHLTGNAWQGATVMVENPTLAELHRQLRERQPLIVHVTGIDIHQGAELLDQEDRRFNDGLYLRSGKQAAPVSAEDFSNAFHRSAAKLVGLNLYHSAARIAPLLIAAGVEAAVGFQDTIDDTIAEIFYAEFYRRWSMTGDPGSAFHAAIRNLMRGNTSIGGAGIVLWSHRSLLPTNPKSTAKNIVSKLVVDEAPGVFNPDASRGLDWDKLLKLEIELRPNINYSLLHNGGSLFNQFYLRNLTGQRIEDLSIQVSLNLGDINLEQTKSLTLTGAGADLRQEIPLSLISTQLRRFRETIKTSLKIAVRWRDHLVYDKNLVLDLLPINEWLDSETDRHWLPSFVQPRDPAVIAIKDKAKKWLHRLTGDATAGFSGYQGVESGKEETWESVNHQVEAIWSALAYEYSIFYTNPPPTYTDQSQRIRTPTEIIESQTGTCLDLTILMAACLEEIDVYPVIFLLNQHAFPGYWQHEDAHWKFWEDWDSSRTPPVSKDRQAMQGKLDERDRHYQWLLNKRGFDRMLKAIHHGLLIPIESVWLTSHSKLDEAIEAGGENLIDRREFLCMLDLPRARANRVLPLPENF